MNEIIFLVEEAPEGGYVGRALSTSIFTEGDTIDALRTNILDAVRCHFADAPSPPKVVRLHLVKDEILQV